MTSAVALTCRYDTVADLLRRAAAMPNAHGAGALRVACEAAETTDDGGRRLRLEQPALEFVEEQAPDLAAKWPQVFETVESSVGPTLGMVVALAHGLSGGSVSLELDVDWKGDVSRAAVRLPGGERLVFEPDGAGLRVTWNDRPPRPSELAMAASERERRQERRTFRAVPENDDVCTCGSGRWAHQGSAAWCP